MLRHIMAAFVVATIMSFVPVVVFAQSDQPAVEPTPAPEAYQSGWDAADMVVEILTDNYVENVNATNDFREYRDGVIDRLAGPTLGWMASTAWNTMDPGYWVPAPASDCWYDDYGYLYCP